MVKFVYPGTFRPEWITHFRDYIRVDCLKSALSEGRIIADDNHME